MGDTPHGMLKLNVNRPFRDSDKNGGWGYVIRDERGEVIQSGSGRAPFAINPIQMELIASIEGVKATISLGVNNIILEIDAQQVVWAIQGDDFRLAVVGGLVHELKELVVENFASFLVKYAPRDCNRVAHELASIGSRSHDLAPSVLAGVPNCIMVLVSGDLVDMVE
jgi:ribonuclease HI